MVGGFFENGSVFVRAGLSTVDRRHLAVPPQPHAAPPPFLRIVTACVGPTEFAAIILRDEDHPRQPVFPR